MGSPGDGQHFLKWGKRRSTFVTEAEFMIHVQPGPSDVPLILQHTVPEFVMLSSSKSFFLLKIDQSKENQTEGVRFLKGRGRS